MTAGFRMLSIGLLWKVSVYGLSLITLLMTYINYFHNNGMELLAGRNSHKLSDPSAYYKLYRDKELVIRDFEGRMQSHHNDCFYDVILVILYHTFVFLFLLPYHNMSMRDHKIYSISVVRTTKKINQVLHLSALKEVLVII